MCSLCEEIDEPKLAKETEPRDNSIDAVKCHIALPQTLLDDIDGQHKVRDLHQEYEGRRLCSGTLRTE